MKQYNYINIFLIIILIAMATSPAFALGENNRNLLLIGFMFLSPLILLRYLEFGMKDLQLVLFVITIILCPLIFHPDTMRWSTVLFTAMFCVTFMAHGRLLYHGSFTPESYRNVLKYLIYAFTIVLLVQQLCVLNDWAIPNLSNYDSKNPWKLNSLTSEPSNSARIVGLLMYCYIVIQERIRGEKYSPLSNSFTDKWVWLCFIWTMATMMSGTAFLFLALVLVRFVRLRTLLPLCLIILAITFIVQHMEVAAINRTYKFAKAVLTLNEHTIVAADHSASFRIVPFMRFTKMLDLTTLNGWFGNGVDFVQSRYHTMFVGVKQGAIPPSGLISIAIDYGFLAFIQFVWFSISVCIDKKDIQSYFFWSFMILLISINSQLLWLTLILFQTNKHFKQQVL